MLDLTKLTDAEVACLTYAIEKEHDDMRKSRETFQTTINVAGNLRDILTKEYTKRQLDWSMFMED